MIAIAVPEFGGPDVLELRDVPIPQPGPEQLRIRVRASTVAKIDISTRNGAISQAGLLGPHHDIGLGCDVEYVILHESALTNAPLKMTNVQAATIPLAGLTADRGLAPTGVGPGQTLLVTGAAGGVGGFVLELARLRNVRTIAVAAPEDETLVRGLGANEFVARTDALGEAVRHLVPSGVDAVIDTALIGIAAHEALRGGGTSSRSLPHSPRRQSAEPTSSCKRCTPTAPDWPSFRRSPKRSSSPCGSRKGSRSPKRPKAHRLVEGGGQRGRIVLEV
jgi:NADPH2:quinone reductase